MFSKFVFASMVFSLFAAGSFRAGSSDSAGHQPVTLTKDQANSLATLCYQAILFRDPDIQGLEDHTKLLFDGQIPGAARNAARFAESSEFLTVTYPNHDSLEILTNLFKVFLGRNPVQHEIDDYLWIVDSGNTQRVVEAIWNGHEFYQKRLIAGASGEGVLPIP